MGSIVSLEQLTDIGAQPPSLWYSSATPSVPALQRSHVGSGEHVGLADQHAAADAPPIAIDQPANAHIPADTVRWRKHAHRAIQGHWFRANTGRRM